MVKFNGAQYEYHQGMSLEEIISLHNLSRDKVDAEICVFIVNGAAVALEQAQARAIDDGDTIFAVPKIAGG